MSGLKRGGYRIRVPAGFTPRAWARAAYARYLEHPHTDFAVNACPGAGKTKFAVMLALNEMRRKAVDRIDLVGPSTHICLQWMREMATWGLHLDPENTRESPDCHGRVMTYQRLGMDPAAFRVDRTRRTLVILDEIHHAGDAKSWGDALQDAFGEAEKRLLLSGTPFRSDNSRIPFVRYSHDKHGVSISDFTYGYGDALRDGYCAPIYFPHHDGEFHWERGGQEHRANFTHLLSRDQDADRLRTALEPRGEYVRGMLTEAHRHLRELRTVHPDAAGIVFGRDCDNVVELADVLADISGRMPITVTVDNPDAGERIRRFRHATDPWIVSVKMVSEGVDIPRLRVGVYLTNVKTEMFFRQAAGRLVRLVPELGDQAGYMYIPSLPRLVGFATDMQRERRHVVEARQKGELVLPGEAEELPQEEDEERAEYRFVNSRGERVGLIESGPPTESTGQTLFEFAEDLAVEEEPSPPPRQRGLIAPEPMLLHEKKENVRRRGSRLSSLVQDVHLKFGVPHRSIHAQLNKRQRVKSQKHCSLDQLQERERLLEVWLRHGQLR